MRSATVFLSCTLAAGAYASTDIASHQCILADLSPSSPRATCSSRSATLIPLDIYEERQYTEIALHYLDGMKNIISATGNNPHCVLDVPGPHPISSPRVQDTRPYKATWTRIRYITWSLGESPCAGGIISENVSAISIQAFPADTSAGIEAGVVSSHELGEADHSEHPIKQLGVAITTEDVDYVPNRRRATFGELCQLLALLVTLGALHYVSAQFAARWQAPPPIERRSPQCE